MFLGLLSRESGFFAAGFCIDGFLTIELMEKVKFPHLRFKCGGKSHFCRKAKIEGRMVDALAQSGDEGRGVAAISLGEVLSNL